MSMSTKIDDLPSPDNAQPPHSSTHSSDGPHPNLRTMEQTSNISLDVHKPNTTEGTKPTQDGLLTRLKNEISEENVLLLIFMFLAASQFIDKYLGLLPVVGTYMQNSGMTAVAIKCAILLVLYILIKVFLLPKLQL
jgi:hypothetical protein